MAEVGKFQLKCRGCEASIDISSATDGVLSCPYCGNTYTLPKENADPAVLGFLRSGEHDLDMGDFDGAYAAYSKAAELDPSEPEAYFGMALATFGVRYIRDVSGDGIKLRPVCYEVSGKRFSRDGNYLSAVKAAGGARKSEYERKAQEIDDILTKFNALKKSGTDYDCFICAKVTDGEGGKTQDSKDADYIYRLLKERGYRPFYSENDLRFRQGEDYEAHILYALRRSSCMIVVCRNEEYLQTPWVRNEYSRFLKLVNDEEKDSDSITIAFYKNVIERLPGKRGRIQGVDLSSPEAGGQITDFVARHVNAARADRAEWRSQDLHKFSAPAVRPMAPPAPVGRPVQPQIAPPPAAPRITGYVPPLSDGLQPADEKRRAEYARRHRKYAGETAGQPEYIVDGAELVHYNPNHGINAAVAVPAGISAIGAWAFEESKIKSIVLPEGVTVIGNNSFDSCRNLESITIPGSLKRIEVGAFRYCTRLKRVYISDIAAWCGIKFGGARDVSDANPLVLAHDLYLNGSPVETLEIPGNATHIGNFAFTECNSIKKVVISEGVTSIGRGAFSKCINLKTVVIPESVTEIGADAFASCLGVTFCCAAKSKPAGWDDGWSITGKTTSAKAGVVWDHKGNQNG